MGKLAAKKVTVNLDKEREIRLGLNAMVSFEEITGHNLRDGSFNTDKMSIKDMRVLLWLCLRHEDKQLTEEDVGDMIHAGNLSELTEALIKAFGAAMPESTGELKGDNTADPTNRPAG